MVERVALKMIRAIERLAAVRPVAKVLLTCCSRNHVYVNCVQSVRVKNIAGDEPGFVPNETTSRSIL
jgi:hypothetical protein